MSRKSDNQLISEATLRAIFNNSPQAITFVGADGQVQAFNEIANGYAKKVFGQTMRIGVPIYNYLGTENLAGFTYNFQLALTGQVVRVETSLQDIEGELNWFEFIFNPVIDEGQIEGVYISVMPINERKRLEATLANSERRYRAIVEDQTELICRFLDERTITFANEAYCRYFDKTREELSAEGFIPHVFEADKALIKNQLDALSQDNPVGTLEYRVVRLNQEIRWTQWHNRAIFDAQGQILEFQSVGRDITEHKQAKESLEQRNRELTLLNRASQAFISTLDLDEVLTSVLEEVRRSLNVVACSVWLVDPETNELVCQQVTDPQSEIVRGWRLSPGQGLGGWVVQHGQSWIVSDVLESKQHFKGVDEQTGLPIRSILTIPLRTKKGVIGVLQMVDQTVDRFDATDQRLGEALAVFAASAIENAQLYEQAQQDAETKALLLDEIHHRVKNNLAAIIGLLYAERRHTDMENEATYQMIMERLISRVQGLATVHNLLSESGWSPLRLHELATQIIHTALQALLPHQQVFIDVSPSPVLISPKQAHSLALVINELTTNTLKYALAERDVAHIRVEIVIEERDSLGRMVRFEFRDDGPGYPDDVLRKERREVGMYMIQSITHKDLRGKLILDNDNGAVTTICFKLME